MSVSERLADDADTYLDSHDIYGLLASLMKQLVVAQPEDPYPFLIDALSKPTHVLHAIVSGTGTGGGSRKAQDAHAQHIASAFGVDLISADSLVASAIASGSQAGAAAKAMIDAKKPVDDDLLGGLVEARLNDANTKRNGWVLVGFPNSRTGAQRLAHGGLLATHFLYLTDAAHPPGAVPATATGSTAADATTAAAMAVAPNAPVHEFYSHCKTDVGANHYWPELEKWLANPTAAEAGPAISTVTHTTTPSATTASASQNSLHSDTKSTPGAAAAAPGTTAAAGAAAAAAVHSGIARPRRPLRIALLGPRGAGKSTQAAVLAQALGVVHVSPGQLLRAEVRMRSSLADSIQPYLASGALVPDDVVTAVVAARLIQSDCKRHGFLLDGYPATAKQAASLAAASCVPRRVVVLAPGAAAGSSGHSDSKNAWITCRDRLVYRRFDPVTGHFYHIKSNPVPPQPIGGRLVQRPEDTEEYVKSATKAYTQHIDDVLKALKGAALGSAHTITIDAALPVDACTTAILQHIHTPLNAQISPNPSGSGSAPATSTAAAKTKK